jgi:hypothetical protein
MLFVEWCLRLLQGRGEETTMTDGPTDPRLELTIDDLMTLSGAVAIALPTINDVDRVRYEALAAKLATILLRVGQREDPGHAEMSHNA